MCVIFWKTNHLESSFLNLQQSNYCFMYRISIPLHIQEPKNQPVSLLISIRSTNLNVWPFPIFFSCHQNQFSSFLVSSFINKVEDILTEKKQTPPFFHLNTCTCPSYLVRFPPIFQQLRLISHYAAINKPIAELQATFFHLFCMFDDDY